MADPVTAPMAPAAVLDLCLASVPAGTAIVPAGARPQFDEPGMQLRTRIATEGGDALLVYGRTVENVTRCELRGGDFPDPEAGPTMLWRDHGDRLLSWLDTLAARPDAIDRRTHPDYEAVFLCDGPGRDPIAPGAGSFRPEDEMEEEPPRFPPDGGILGSVGRWPGLTCDGLRGAL